MKKTIIYITIILSACVLMACKNDKNTASNMEPVTDTTCYGNNLFNISSFIAESDTGVYRLNQGYDYYITYISKKNNTSVYLCSKADCSHTGGKWNDILPTCDSYVGEVLLESIRYYDNKIYVLQFDEATHIVSLMEISKDGSVHKKLLDIGKAPENISSLYAYVIYDNYAYILYNPERLAADDPCEFYRMSLDTGKKEIIQQSSDCRCNYLKYYNGNLFFIKDMINQDPNGYNTSILCRYNIADGTFHDIVESNMLASYTINNIKNSILYWDDEKGLFEVDLFSGSTQLLKEADDSIRNPWLACNGKYICIDNYFSKGVSGHITELLDENGNTVAKINNEKGSLPQLLGNEYLFKRQPTETGMKLFYLFLDDITTGKELEWKMFEE